MTAIVGANGTGKTTLLEAVTFALYGEQRENKDSLRFYWADERAKLKVTLEFEFDNREYVLERTETKATLTDKSADPPVVKATGLREVKGACERLLRLTYHQFRNSFCAEQKGLAFLQFNTDTRRQEQVAKMLGFDRLRQAAELAREHGKTKRAIAEGLALNLGDPAALNRESAAAKAELGDAEQAANLASELLTELQSQMPAAEERRKLADEFFRLTEEAGRFASNAEALKSAKKRAEEAHARAAAAAKRREELTPAFTEFGELEGKVREMLLAREQELDREKLAAEAARLHTEVGEMSARIAALALGDLRGLRASAKQCADAIAPALTAVKSAELEWSKERQSLQHGVSTAQAEMKAAVAALEKARNLVAKGICPECGQPTATGFETKLEQLEQEVAKAQKSLKTAADALKALDAKPSALVAVEKVLTAVQRESEKAQAELNAAEKKEAEAKGLKSELALKEKRAAALAAELAKEQPKYDRETHLKIESRMKELRPLWNECLTLGKAADDLKSAERNLAEASKEIEGAKQRYHSLLADRAKLPFEGQTEAEGALKVFEGLRVKISQAELQKEQAAGLVKFSRARVGLAEEKLAKYVKEEAQLKEMRSAALLHETAEKELKSLREELNSVILPELESRASDTLSLLTNGRYPVLELDDEFNATLVEDGTRKAVISGGEEDVVALALRMALSELIQERQGRPMSLLILDEVFGSLDVDRRQAVLEQLQAIRGRFAQILVISHIEEINQVADQCVFLRLDAATHATVVGDPPLETEDLVLTP